MEISLTELRDLIVRKEALPCLPDKEYGVVVLILRNGFIFVGHTQRTNGVGYLRGYQLRYWAKRDGGLPELAAKGRLPEDKLDPISGVFEFPWSDQNVVGVLPCQTPWNLAD